MTRSLVAESPNRGAGLSGPLRIAFVDLLDAAPLIAAVERGFFRHENLTIVLCRQLGWGSIRDRLTFGDLDAAHALLGMPLFSRLRLGGFLEPLVALMNLGAGGNAITLSRRLIDAGIGNTSNLARNARAAAAHRPVFAHVFNCSMHHFLLRQWLADGGVDPDRDVHLRFFPPNQMAGHVARGDVDGFCAGEPWNTVVERDGIGQIAAVTTEILPDHPEKIFATTARWAAANRGLLVPMLRAVLRGCLYCSDPINHVPLAATLARPQYLNLPANDLRKSLALRGGEASLSIAAHSFAATHTFPSKTHSAWMATQMIRWGQLPPESDARALAESCCDASAYRAAARSLDLSCPATDFPPMPLRMGTYDASGSPGSPGSPASPQIAAALALHA